LLIGEIRNAQAELGKRVDRRGLAGAKELEPATTLEQFTAGLRIAWRTDEQRPTHRRPYRRRKPIPQRVSMLDDLREQIGAWMVEEPGLPAIAILERLKSLHPDRFTDKHERTVQRAVKRDGAPNKRIIIESVATITKAKCGQRLSTTMARPRGSTATSRASLRQTRGGRCTMRGSLLWTSGTTRSVADMASPGNICR
jgi:hypothetical protein